MVLSVLMTALLPHLFQQILGDSFPTDYNIQQAHHNVMG
jgi:hypothetical protein